MSLEQALCFLFRLLNEFLEVVLILAELLHDLFLLALHCTLRVLNDTDLFLEPLNLHVEPLL